ncbi:leucine-rich repeat domain-containing protein [Spirosoma arcticum]
MSDLARQLIADNQRTQAPFLDLGNCDLTTLPNELFTLTWLVELNLSDYYRNKTNSEWVETQNIGSENRLTADSLQRLGQLLQLRSLALSANRIEDYRFLKNLPQLQSLVLRNNRFIKKYTFLEKLTELQNFALRNNQIEDYAFLERLTQLQTLDLSTNQMSANANSGHICSSLTLFVTQNQHDQKQMGAVDHNCPPRFNDARSRDYQNC